MYGRTQWNMIFLSMVAAVPIYGVVIWLMVSRQSARPDPPAMLSTLFPLFPLLAAGLLVASATWMVYRSRAWAERAHGGSSALPPPPQFQQIAITAMALAEASAVLGFVRVLVGGPAAEYAGYGAGTLAVLLGVIWPRASAYWNAWEEEQRRSPRDA